MPLPRLSWLTPALYIAGVCLAVLIAPIALIYLGSVPDYDTHHPDYRHITGEMARAGETSRGEASAINLAPLNGGRWQKACLFGGYTDPVREMEKSGASITAADRARLGEAWGLRLHPVEEKEALVAFADPERRAHFVHVRSGLGSFLDHFHKCIDRPETVLTLG